MFTRNGSAEDAAPTNQRQRLLLVAAGGLALVALLFFVVMPALVGGGEDLPEGVPPAAAGIGVRPVPSATATPTNPAPAAPATVAIGRDPFAPLANEAAPAPVAAAEPAVLPAPAPAPAPEAAPVAAVPAPAAGHSVTLLSVDGDTARFTVDGTERTAKAGDDLANGLLIVKITPEAVHVTYQDKLYALAPGESQSF